MLTLLTDLTPAAAVCLAVSLFAGSLVPFFLLINVSFDPRPVVRRWLASDAGCRVVVVVFNAKAAVCDFALDAAALLILLMTSPKGTVR